MSLLRLSPEVYKQLRAHGEESYPRECCGVLLGELIGDDWTVRDAVKTRNLQTDSAHNRYQIPPEELIAIERAARARKLSIAGFYHSHPDQPAQWSETDLNEAHWIGCSYVITSVEQGKAGATNSYRLTGASEQEKRFAPEEIQLQKNPAANNNS